MNRTALAIKMLRYLRQNEFVKKQELADFLETNPRNIKELRNELEIAGYTIEILNGPYGGYRLGETSSLPLVELSALEKEALHDATGFLMGSNQPVLNNTFKEGYLKLVNSNQSYTSISSETSKLVMSNLEIEKRLDIFREAIASKVRTKVQYQRGLVQTKSYVFEPYDLLVVNNLWYVVGYIKGKHWASLKVNRILEIEMLEETYLYDENFSTQSMLGTFGFKFSDAIDLQVIIQNHNYASEYEYGENQRVDVIDDTTFELNVRLNSKLRAQSFILQFGSDIKIIAPQWLNQFQYEHAQKITNRKD